MQGLQAPNSTQIPNEFLDEIMPEITSMSELKVTLAVIRVTFGIHDKAVPLSIKDIMELTGLAKQTVLDGLAAALERGFIARVPNGNSFAYYLVVRDSDQNGTRFRPQTVRDSDRLPEKSLRDSDRFENPIPLTRLKKERKIESELDDDEISGEARFHARLQNKPDPVFQKVEAKRFFKQTLGPDNFDHPQIQKNFLSFFQTLGKERLTELWKQAFEQTQKPSLFWFIDVCKGVQTQPTMQLKRESVAPREKRHNPFERGQMVKVCDGVIREVADYDEISNSVLFFDSTVCAAPEDCVPLPA